MINDDKTSLLGKFYEDMLRMKRGFDKNTVSTGAPSNMRGLPTRTPLDERLGEGFVSETYGEQGGLAGRYVGEKKSGANINAALGGDTSGNIDVSALSTGATGSSEPDTADTSQSEAALGHLGFKKDEFKENLGYAKLGQSAAGTLLKGAELLGEKTPESDLLGKGLGELGTGLDVLNIGYDLYSGKLDKAARDTTMAVIKYYGSTATSTATATSSTGAAGATSSAPASTVGYATPLAIIAAASTVRDIWGNTKVPYEDRSSAQQTVSAPGAAGALLPAALGKQAFGDSSDVAKAYDWMAKKEDKYVGKTLSKAFNGPYDLNDNVILDLRNNLQDTIKENFGETGGTVINYVTDPISTLIRKTCIVYGYLYGRSSKQTRTALIYCAKEMTEPKLLGYYSIGKKIIQMCDKFPKTRKWVEKIMAEPFFDYMTWRIGKGIKPKLWSRIFSPVFLQLCRGYYYSGLEIFYPEGYERCVQSTKDRLIPQES